MHEQSDAYQMLIKILDHPKNKDRNPQEREALAKRLKRMTYVELELEWYALS
jgi:hypothetical protein